MTAMNICYLIRSFSTRAGTESYVHHTSMALARLGHRVHIVSLTGSGRRTFEGQEDRVTCHQVALSGAVATRKSRSERDFPLSLWQYGKSIAMALPAIIDSQAIDIVEATDWGMDAWAYLPGRRVPVCVRLHGYPGFKDEFDRRVLKERPRKYIEWRIFRRHIVSADLVTGVSRAYVDFARKAWELGGKDIQVIPIAIDPGTFHAGDVVRAKDSILFVGRLEESKGIEILADAIPMILRRRPGARFYLAGDDRACNDNRQTWSQWLHTRFGAGAVAYVGSRSTDELVQLYRAAAVCVVPSLYEPGGTVAFEAMACGCPVIASRVGGLEEIIQHGQTGLLVPAGDAAALAGAVTELLQDERLRLDLARNALASVRRKYPIDAIARQTAQAYLGAIQAFHGGN